MSLQDPVATLNAALAGRYQIRSEIGRGGMGAVYLADDLRHDRAVALKVLRPELASSLGADRFLREIRVTARLEHPHILPLLDSGDAAGQLFYVMPFVDGESLRARLARQGPLALEDVLRIARDLAGALAHAHDQGIIHRDIKPENVMLAGGHARIVDFGIARAISAVEGEGLTSAGLAIGTPAYMSPEQAAGAADARSDVYSLGCVIYEMLTGRSPFSGRSPHEILARHALDSVPSLAAARPGLPPALERAVMTALAKAPADRFATARGLAEALAPNESGDALTGSRPVPTRPRRVLIGAAVFGALVLLALLLLRPFAGGQPSAGAISRSAIAVLPFQNLSTDERHTYFSSGLHDELLTQLSKVSALRVISRTSVMRYADGKRSIREIAGELGVGSVVEGSVQVEGGRLRVNVQLIDATTDEHLWADRYDRALDDAFAIQSDVATQIVRAVGAALTNAESRGIERAPTADPEAYRLYLQAQAYWTRPGRHREEYDAAERLLIRALALDSTFALAHAALAEVDALTFLLRYDPSPERAARAIASAEAAVRLAPDLPRAHEAVGIAYGIGKGDFRGALTAFQRSAEGQPNDARLRQRIGFTRRMLGEWDSAVTAFARSTELDPHDGDMFFHLGYTQHLMRRDDDALRAFAEAQRLAPNLHSADVSRAWVYARRDGNLDSLAKVLERLPASLSLGPIGGLAVHTAALQHWRRDPAALLAVLETASGDALEWELAYHPVALYAGWAWQLRSDRPAARAAFDSARRVVQGRLARTPDDWRIQVALGLILAAQGHRDSALEIARRLEPIVVAERGYIDLKREEDRARILAQAGEAGLAVAIIERQLEGPGWLTPQVLRLDPTWDRIRNDPRFQALLRSPPR